MGRGGEPLVREVDLLCLVLRVARDGAAHHVTWGVDRKVGNVVAIPSALARYQLSGGEYYFCFLSGVDNTRVAGNWRRG